MKRLASYTNEQQAALVEVKLKDAGIHCFIKNQHVTNLKFGHGVNSAFEIDLMVANEDFDTAAKILGISLKQDKIFCPNCNSTNTEPKFAKNPALMVFMMLFAFIPLPIFREKNICKDCGAKF